MPRASLMVVAVGVALGAGLFGVPAVAAVETVTICHLPPGNPSNFRTLEVPQRVVQKHISHGDSLGACETGAVCPCSGQSDPFGNTFWDAAARVTSCVDSAEVCEDNSTAPPVGGCNTEVTTETGGWLAAGNWEGNLRCLIDGYIPVGVGGEITYDPEAIPTDQAEACRAQLRQFAAAWGVQCQVY